MDFSVDTATDAVIDSFEHTPDERLRTLLAATTRHLHELVREVQPTLGEWEYAIEFLTGVGKKCDATRQEFVLLSDVLGVSMLVETINGAEDGTESTVLGPFHMTKSPSRALGDTIAMVGGREVCVVSGRVLDTHGQPISGASIDVWQCNEEGSYDVQQPDTQPPGNGRGKFTSDADGHYWFRIVVPSYYPIPTDGPVGTLLAATDRHPYRPAHIHFILDAPGHQSVTTHLFVAGGEYLDSDAVFAVKRSLITDFQQVNDQTLADDYGVEPPFRQVRADFVMMAEA